MALPEGWEVEPLPEDWEVEPEKAAPPESLRDVLARKFSADAPLGQAVRTLAPQISAAEALYGGARAPVAGIRAFGQGASGRLTDEAAGVVGALNEFQGRYPVAGSVAKAMSGPVLGPASGLTPGNEQFPREGLIDALSKRYSSERDIERQAIERAKGELPPGAFRSLETAGGLVMPGSSVGKVKTISDFARAAKTGAAQGGIMGFGGASGGLASQAIDTAAGAAAGGVLTPVLGAMATKGGDYLKPKLTELSQTHAIEAINQPGIADRMAKILKTKDVEVQRKFLLRLMDEGTIGFGDSAENIAKKAQQKVDLLGPQIGAYIEKGETGFAAAKAGATERNAAKMAQHAVAREAAAQRLASASTPAEFNAARAAMPPPPQLEPVPDIANEFGSMAKAVRGSMADRPQVDIEAGGGPIESFASGLERETQPSMRNLQMSKSNIQGRVKEPTDLQKEMLSDAAREARGSYVESMAKVLPPEDVETFVAINKKYADAMNALDIAGNKASREATKKAGTQAGTEAASRVAEQVGGAGGAVLGAGTKLADKLFQRRGPASLATAYGAISKVVPGSEAAQYVTGQGLKWAGLQSLLGGVEKQKEDSAAAYKANNP